MSEQKIAAFMRKLEKNKTRRPIGVMVKRILCRLVFHKWRIYIAFQDRDKEAREREGIFWVDLAYEESRGTALSKSFERVPDEPYERRKCNRCGIVQKRKICTSQNGVVSYSSWETDTSLWVYG